MPRLTIAFALSDPRFVTELIREFSLHLDVTARVGDSASTLLVDTIDTASAVWEVRATVGMFDEGAVEIEAQG